MLLPTSAAMTRDATRIAHATRSVSAVTWVPDSTTSGVRRYCRMVSTTPDRTTVVDLRDQPARSRDARESFDIIASGFHLYGRGDACRPRFQESSTGDHLGVEGRPAIRSARESLEP